MSINEIEILKQYSSGREDTRATWSRASGLEFHYTKKLLDEYIKPDSKVIEIGCATGYYGMFFTPKCASYTGVDITPEHINIFKEKINGSGLNNITAVIGDATNLSQPDDFFDVVLCLGPMYHLPFEEREKVFAECKRIAKPGAIVAFAYISSMGAYLKGILMRSDVYPNPVADEYCLRQQRDDIKPNTFFFTTPEEISKRASKYGLLVVKNAGTDFTFNDTLLNEMSEEQFSSYMTFSDFLVAHESCTGLSNHSILICKK